MHETTGTLEDSIMLIMTNEYDRYQDMARLVEGGKYRQAKWRHSFYELVGYYPEPMEPISHTADVIQEYVMDELYNAQDAIDSSLVNELISTVRQSIDWEDLARRFIEDVNERTTT